MPVAAAPVLTFPELGAQLTPVESTRDGTLVEVTTHFKRRAHWWQSSALIVGNVVGTGVLSMPYAAAGLGWVMSAFALLIFAFASTYAGVLLARVRNDFHPKCSSYAELAYAIAGRRFGLFTRCMVVSGWVMLLPYYLIGTADSLRVLFQADAVLCTWQWTSIVALLLLLPLQLTTLTSISYLTWPSTLAILIAILLIISGFGGGSSSSDSSAQRVGTTSTGMPRGGTFLDAYGSLASFVFAYQGHSMFLEIQSEMIDGRRFPTACRVAYSFISMVYTFTTTVAYGMQGDAVAPFLPDSLTDGALKRVVGACLAFHILVAYVVTAQPLTAFLYSKAFRATPLHPTTPAVRLRWLLVTSGYLAWSVLCSNAVPFFGDLQELIGGFNGAPIIFGWPALFYLGAARQRGRAVSRLDRVLCSISLFIVLPVFTVLGTASALFTIIEDVGQTSAPFQCGDSGAASRNGS